MTWDEYYLGMCVTVASKSKDRSTKCGVVVVGPANEVRTIGYNGFARGVDDDVEERHERPEKYKWVVHAEANAIANAARCGTPLEGTTIYLTGPPCNECSKLIINSGMKEVVYPIRSQEDYRERWSAEIILSRTMLDEAGVEVRTV